MILLPSQFTPERVRNPRSIPYSLLRMSIAGFVGALASIAGLFVYVILAGAITGNPISLAEFGEFLQAPSAEPFGLASIPVMGLAGVIVGGIYQPPIGLLIGSALTFGIARALGGMGEYRSHIHAMSLYTAPLQVIVGFFLLMPRINIALYLLGAAWWLVLTARTVRVIHDLSLFRSVAVVAAVLFGALGILVVVLLVPTLWFLGLI